LVELDFVWEAIMVGAALQIFVSHKSKDFEKASAVERALRMFTDEVQFNIAENIPKGNDWSNWIKEKLSVSDILLLLYTDPTEEWDWCLYEAGLFTPLNSDDYRRVICIYAQDSDPPRPLGLLQGVRATKEEIRKLLRTLLMTNELVPHRPPLRPGLQEDALDAPAAEIAKLFSPTVRRAVDLIPRLSVRVPHAASFEDDLPADAVVELRANAGEIVANLFLDSTTWGALRAAVPRQEGTFWLDELARAARAVAHGQRPAPISSTFRAATGAQIYRPVLLNVEIKGDQPLLFSVGLVPEYAPEADFIGDESGRVFHLIRIATRFRWEILEPFMRRAPRLRDGEARQIFCKQLKESILLIEAESERAGYLEQDNVIRAFEEPEDIELIERLYEQWYREREDLMQAVDDIDIERIVSNLKSLKQANVRFMEMSTRRYATFFQRRNGGNGAGHVGAEENLPIQ
jgi:TIR domain